MRNTQDVGSAEVWRAAQHRRAEDLAEWFDEKPFATRGLLSRVALRGLALTIAAFVALASVSAVFHDGRKTRSASGATGTISAVKLP
jgi:hypothetical protein